MLRLLCVAAFFLACFADDDVVIMTEKNFESTIAENELVMVEFFALWCGHCKRLAPEYAKAATKLKAKGVVLGTVDATVETGIASKFQIEGYPTLKVFRSGVPTAYEGGRTANDIVSYLIKQSGPPVTELATAKAVAEFIGEETVVISYAAAGSKQATFISDFAKAHRDDFTIGSVADAAIAGSEAMDTIVLFKNFDEKKNVYSGALDAAELLSFLSANSMPLVDEIGPENYKKYVDRKIPLAWTFLDPEDTTTSDAVKAALAAVAPDHKGKVSMVWLSGKQYPQMAERMGLSGKVFPSLAIEDAAGLHFTHSEEGEMTAASIKTFVDSWASGKMKPTVKSEPIPDPAHEDNVRILVAHNFDEIVMDTKKDVFIEFYAPWCGHCKQLTPKYAELAGKLTGNKNLVIAKVDATANDVPKAFEVQGFPTLKLVKANNNEIVSFEGDRSVEGMLAFLKEHAALPIEEGAAPEEEGKDEL